ncbi:MAG: tetratricopeptide repeat protein [Pyrinomonadaceae bacterium]
MIESAVQAAKRGDLEKAALLLKKVIAAAPKNVVAHTLAGIVADRRNELPAAEWHFAIAAKLEPNSPETRNNYGAILLRLKRTREAEKEFAASLKANPNQPSAQVNLAQIYFERGTLPDLRVAQKLFEKASQIGADIELARVLVVIALRLGETERAARDFQSYFSFAKNANQMTAARLELGAALLERNLNAEAIQELESAISVEGANVQALIQLSRAFLRINDIKNAGKTLESAIANGVDDAKLYAALADVYQAGGFIENAIPAMRMAIEKDPANEIYRARYGLLLIDSKAPAAAIVRLQESVKLFPQSARIWLVLGIAQLTDGKSAEAKTAFEKSLEIEPKSVPALSYLATVSIDQADYVQGAALYQRSVDIEEGNAYLHFLLAETLAKIPTSDPAVIEKHLKRATEIDQTLAAGHLALGKLKARSLLWQQAVAEFEQAVKYEPELAEVYYQLGRVLTRLKRSDEARAAFAKHKVLAETQSAKKETDRREYVRRLANVRF